MNDNFPLYERLLRDTTNKDLLIKEKIQFQSRVEVIDLSGRELMYALIKYHSQKSKNDVDEKMYNCIIKNTNQTVSNLTWNIDDIPVRLRRILYKFTEIHEQHQEEQQIQLNNLIKLKTTHDM